MGKNNFHREERENKKINFYSSSFLRSLIVGFGNIIFIFDQYNNNSSYELVLLEIFLSTIDQRSLKCDQVV